MGLTVSQIGILYLLHLVGLAPNMTLYDAVTHPLTTVSTSGFSPRPESLAAFSPAVQWVTIVFMIVGATNFILLYLVLQGQYKRLYQSDEFRFYIGVLVLFSLGVASLLILEDGLTETIGTTVRHAIFQVVSITTTTGYASTDFDLWSASTKNLLFICMFIGGMAGSTTCSIKAIRWLLVVKAFQRDLFVASHPQAIRPVRLSGEVVDEETIREIYAYILVSLVFFITATVFIVFDT